MVEAGQIDWAGHSRDGGWTAAEVLAFDEAIEAAYGWARTRTDTLIVVTADHETGDSASDRNLDVVAMRKQTASTEWMWGAIRTNPTAARVTSVMSTYAGITNLTTAERNLILANKEMGISDVLAARFKVDVGPERHRRGRPHRDAGADLRLGGRGRGTSPARRTRTNGSAPR